MHFPVVIHCIMFIPYSGKGIFINEACLASFTAFETRGDSPWASDAILINANLPGKRAVSAVRNR
jgi:hypothetical protein